MSSQFNISYYLATKSAMKNGKKRTSTEMCFLFSKLPLQNAVVKVKDHLTKSVPLLKNISRPSWICKVMCDIL